MLHPFWLKKMHWPYGLFAFFNLGLNNLALKSSFSSRYFSFTFSSEIPKNPAMFFRSLPTREPLPNLQQWFLCWQTLPSFRICLKNALYLLGIEVMEEM